tara:strand:+ start:1559 stop:1843 length:285 start_codon:yes stop_codon:yes gene_type:complete
VTYRALPEGLFIRSSPIAGQGIFSRNIINEGTELGMSHIIINEEIIRTPLGGFINHSDLPNCEKYKIDNRYYIRVIRPISPMEELFLKYTFYNV